MITINEGKILDQWSKLLERCAGEGEGLLREVEANLTGHEAPGVSWKRESAAPGWLKGLFGKRREFLLVTNERFDDYLMCVGARDYGTNLDVSWYLTASAKSALVSAMLKQSAVEGLNAVFQALDVFDQQDLTAYVTVAHYSVLDAVKALMEKRKLDVARLDRKSRGIFGVS